MRFVHLIGLSVCTLLAAKDVHADPKAVALGEVSVSAGADAAMAPKVTSAVEDELKRLDLSRAKKQAVLSVSVVRVERERRTRGASITCVVSATLRSPTSGAVFAIVEGRARAEGEDARTLETSAMQGAVHGAVTRIPEALR